MLFQTNAPEYDKLFLNKLILGLGIRKYLLLTDRKFKVELLFNSLILNKSVRYSGAILFDTLYITFAFVLSCVCYVLCASVYMCFVVACWEGADLLALVCGVFCEFVTFPLVSWVRCGT